MFKQMIKTKVALAVISLFGVVSSASAVGTGGVFKVEEGVVAGVPASNILTVDSFDFSYTATINQTIVGAFDFVGDNFTEDGNFTVSSFKNGIATPGQFLNAPAIGGGYGFLGDFSASGSAGIVGTNIQANFATFDINMYIDADQNGVGDALLGTASLITGEAHIFGGLANGDFEAVLLFTPTAFGETYFFDPSPFYINMNFAGNTTTVEGASLTESFVAGVDGSGNAFFTVPEPGSIALLGIGLLGMSRLGRKRKAVQS
jgi:hypothetical protein